MLLMDRETNKGETTMNNGQGFPGAPGGGFPGAAGAAPTTGFVLDIPPDPTWEPFETTDVLEMDGLYACRITRESARTDTSKSSGVFITLEILDEDARGKVLSKFLPDPRTTKSNVWFVWRGLIRSITGGLDGARQGFQYRPGTFANQVCYAKTEPYLDGQDQRTSIAQFVTKEEYDAAVAGKRHRWPSKPKTSALPGGLPSAFPMAAFPGMTGPSAPTGFPPAPQPGGAPMTQPPQPAPQPQAAPAFPGFAQPAGGSAPAPSGSMPPNLFPGMK
jgi:hypothetical protein